MFFDFLHTLLQWFLPKKLLTAIIGMFANSTIPRLKNTLMVLFIRHFKVDLKEALQEDYRAYRTFNDFFTRALKPTARPIAKTALTMPVDGLVSEMGAIQNGQLLQAKGRYYSVSELLEDTSMLTSFETGQFITFYLSPKDYHRVHMPIGGKLSHMIHIPGRLFSVQPSTVRTIRNLFSKNERLVVFFETPYGKMVMVLVGAVICGGIATIWEGLLRRKKFLHTWRYKHDHILLEKAAEMGHFQLGSTVILLFEKNFPMSFISSLKSGMPVCMGEPLGVLKDDNV